MGRENEKFFYTVNACTQPRHVSALPNLDDASIKEELVGITDCQNLLAK